MIYSPAFDALPACAKNAVYGRLGYVLSGKAQNKAYARLSSADRQATIDSTRHEERCSGVISLTGPAVDVQFGPPIDLQSVGLQTRAVILSFELVRSYCAASKFRSTSEYPKIAEQEMLTEAAALEGRKSSVLHGKLGVVVCTPCDRLAY
jgi:hypothetical protein